MYKTILSLGALLVNFSLVADEAFGERLERQIWNDIRSHNWLKVSEEIAPACQQVHFGTVSNQAEILEGMKKLDLSDFTLENFKVTEGPDVYVVTYDATVSETIEGQRITSKAARLSTWKNNNGKWQWVAHGIIIPVVLDPKYQDNKTP